MATVFIEIAEHLRRRSIVANEVISSEGEKLHFWGVHGGTTILLRQKGHHFSTWEELPMPLGIATAPFKKENT